jgi:hypothetical protein
MGSEKKLALDLPWRFLQPNIQHQYTYSMLLRQVGVAYDGLKMIMTFSSTIYCSIIIIAYYPGNTSIALVVHSLATTMH